jgi:hypothetical protein
MSCLPSSRKSSEKFSSPGMSPASCRRASERPQKKLPMISNQLTSEITTVLIVTQLSYWPHCIQASPRAGTCCTFLLCDHLYLYLTMLIWQTRKIEHFRAQCSTDWRSARFSRNQRANRIRCAVNFSGSLEPNQTLIPGNALQDLPLVTQYGRLLYWVHVELTAGSQNIAVRDALNKTWWSSGGHFA